MSRQECPNFVDVVDMSVELARDWAPVLNHRYAVDLGPTDSRRYRNGSRTFRFFPSARALAEWVACEEAQGRKPVLL
jgi:hypothetical protein